MITTKPITIKPLHFIDCHFGVVWLWNKAKHSYNMRLLLRNVGVLDDKILQVIHFVYCDSNKKLIFYLDG